MISYSGQIEDILPGETETVNLWGLSLPALAFQLSRLLRGPLGGRKLLLLFPTALEAEEFKGDLEYFWPGGDVTLLPGADRSPFLNKFSGAAVMGERLLAASKLLGEAPAAVVGAVSSLLRKFPGAGTLKGRSVEIEAGSALDFEGFTAMLEEYGYSRVNMVENHGEYSVRGGIVDLFPVGLKRPVRMEFFGDYVDNLRHFLVEDQRSAGKIASVKVAPLSAAPAGGKGAREAAEALEELAREKGWMRLLWEPVKTRLLSGGDFSDFENWSPLVRDNLTDFKSFLKGSGTAVVLYEPGRLKQALEASRLALENHFARLEREERPHLPLDALYEDPESLFQGLLESADGLATVRSLRLAEEVAGAGEPGKNVAFKMESTADLRDGFKTPGMKTGFLLPLVGRVRSLLGRGFKVNLVLRNREQTERLAELLSGYDLSPVRAPVALRFPKPREGGRGGRPFKARPEAELLFSLGELSEGFVSPEDLEAYIAEEEIFGSKRRTRQRASEEIRSLSGGLSLRDLSPGDYVVHTDYGIGQYRGLETKTMSTGYQGEFLAIAYKGGDMLYVPVETFGLVTKYVGATDRPPALDRLGSASWERLKAKIKEDIRAQAEELLELYARRQLAPGFAYSPRDMDYREFENAFPYEETPDQTKAVEEVLKDLGKSHPMDRLVCGDVGFGKTEVAIRAAYRVVSDGKQAAVLVPTTILAEQHERTFKERFKDWPVTVESVSRLKKPAEQKKILEDLAAGGLDIVIGTHRILQGDVKFRDLGLLIIDEEHRFGVAHKEKLKKVKAGVDVLSMSATPIPRSLSMSMSGIRDLSLIRTPPVDRLSIKTMVVKCDDQVISEAVERELARDGQVYLVHNRVRDIHLWVRRLEELLPLVRFGVGHGQLNSRELEDAVLKFWRKEIDVWITTTIVESGLDFPAANTIIIDRADRFGLAQLYQLRGRVGRGREQAYCYLMVDDPDTLTMNAKKRLQAIMDNGDLGSGYQVALHDLQIRGSGNVLGVAQSGAASLVGYELYNQLVEQTVSRLKDEPIPETYEPEIVLGVPAFLPESYAPDTNSRIILYRRLSRAETLKEIRDIEKELLDRFGKPPSEAANLLELARVKILARAVRAARVECSPGGVTLAFFTDQRGAGDGVLQKIVSLAGDPRRGLSLSPKGELFLPWASLNKSLGEIEAVQSLLKFLAKP
ncbi:MAG: transcription-repair coupling factor [Deltaproteobacteria bacterium]|jgi:transcription-repair coupling factor (superfamily II helicase)|nr:transcription-repair coupling factor [Deltaproteobacteria bacterium]